MYHMAFLSQFMSMTRGMAKSTLRMEILSLIRDEVWIALTSLSTITFVNSRIESAQQKSGELEAPWLKDIGTLRPVVSM